jgi:tetrachlorobenzoquinone reductase
MGRHVVGTVAEIPAGGRKKITVEGREITVFNLKGSYYALLDRCPHEGGSLCHGDVVGLVESTDPGTYLYSRPGELVKCPWHGWEFDIRTGQSWTEPKRTKVRAYSVGVERGRELEKGPYQAETFPVAVDEDYVVLDLPETTTVRVASVVQATDLIKVFELRPVAGRLTPFRAGAHIDLFLRPGLKRSYSLVNAETETDRYVVAVALDRASRGGSRHMHENVREGDLLQISAPRNDFPLDESGEPTVLVAGGVGITPIMSMVHRLEAQNLPWTLHYCGRTRPALPFLAELAAYGDKVVLHLDDESGGVFLDMAGLVAGSGPDTHFYCCGPGPMLEAFRAGTAGVDPAHVHYEYFVATAAPATDRSYEVELAQSGQTLTVPQGATILETLLEAGVEVEYDCMQGTCGTCETGVLDGIPDHRDEVLTDSEREGGKTMMVCCSGSRTDRLVLDL